MCFDWSGEYIQHLKIDLKTSGINFIWHFVIPVFPLCFKQLQISRQYLNSRGVCLKKKKPKIFLPQLRSLKNLAKISMSPRASPGCGGQLGPFLEMPIQLLWPYNTRTKVLELLLPATSHQG